MARDLPTLNLYGERKYLEWYGEQLFLALAVGGDHHLAQVNLQKLAARLVKLHSKGLCPLLTQYLIEEVCSMKTEVGRRAQGRFGTGLLPGVFGAVLAAIMLCQHEGFGFDVERIISLVRQQTGASRTDIKNSVLHYTRDADLALSDWLVTEPIARAAAWSSQKV
jgi:hypothetical protein